MADKKDGYEVGYGRPPHGTQFKKGQSGNPKGRPKGTLNLATAIERELSARVTIRENGRVLSLTKREIAARQVVNKAASGDLGAVRLLGQLQDRIPPDDVDRSAPDLAMEDRELVALLTKRGQLVIPDEVDDHLTEEEPHDDSDPD